MILELPPKKPGDPEALPIGAVIDLRREMPDGPRAQLDKGWKVVGYTESGKGRWTGYELEAPDGRTTMASKFEAFDQQQPEPPCMQKTTLNLFDHEDPTVDHETPISERDAAWARYQSWVLSRPDNMRPLCAEFPMYSRVVKDGQRCWVIGYSEDGHVVISDHCPRCYPLEICKDHAFALPLAQARALISRNLN